MELFTLFHDKRVLDPDGVPQVFGVLLLIFYFDIKLGRVLKVMYPLVVEDERFSMYVSKHAESVELDVILWLEGNGLPVRVWQ